MGELVGAGCERYGGPMSGALNRWGTLVLIVLLGAVLGCATRTVREQVYNQNAVTVLLRHRIEKGSVAERGYQHPATVSQERLVHILGALDIEESQGEHLKERRAAIHPELLQPIARGLLAGLAAANPDQEIALMAVRTERNLGVFHTSFLTSVSRSNCRTSSGRFPRGPTKRAGQILFPSRRSVRSRWIFAPCQDPRCFRRVVRASR